MTGDEAIIRKKAQKLFSIWRNDWNRFATDVFGVTLDKEQRAIIRAVQHNRRVSVRSGTARGKDFLSAVAAMCFLYLTPEWDKDGNMVKNTKVALTAPTDRQVKNIMMPEISRLYNRAEKKGIKLPGHLNSSDIRMDGTTEWFLTGFKADDNNQEAWSGFHAVNTMFVVTEATGISDDTFDAIEGNLQGNSRILLVFNPNTTIGYAARSQKSDRWKKFCLNSLNAPNVEEKKIIIPGQVDYEWVKDKVENWCEVINKEDRRPDMDDFKFEGKWYRPSDLFRKKVLGQFPLANEGALIPLKWIEMAQERWKEHQFSNHNYPRIGCDVAGMGRDCTVFCYRFGDYVHEFKKHNSGGKADHMKVVGHLVNDFRTTTGCMTMIDTIGEGAGVFSRMIEVCQEDRRLADQIYNVISCKFSEAAKIGSRELRDITGQYTFQNMRAYLFWAVRDWLDPEKGSKAMLPPGGSFTEEATEIQWSFLSNGKIIIEPKEDIKKRIGHSIDEFDSLANTFYPAKRYDPDEGHSLDPNYDPDAELYY